MLTHENILKMLQNSDSDVEFLRNVFSTTEVAPCEQDTFTGFKDDKSEGHFVHFLSTDNSSSKFQLYII
jgi:hypothetical protein